ncbi:lipocln_cytosolic_FA-bd_dom domain-containing protein [Caerostris darwini]|uniref:Lipocln_cytosolic_FA-bd_dom domain-containing protein n=1 Tax=Caerostris darwini TaxID=1538125 RepID=A0AAV4PDZ9_9ARAC|nr:lipocln_cytosolic_FA-bd_dom domain-containing protein [Caerostris darwini]
MWTQIFFLCISATVGLAAVGSCPTPKVQADFQLEKFAGTWYVIETSSALDKVGKKCSLYKVEIKNPTKASTLHKFVSSITDKWKSEYSELSTPKKNEPAKLLVSPLKGTILARKYPLWVIDTDYDTHAIVYSCQSLLVAYTEDVWILSRTKTLDDEKKMKLYEVIKQRDINQKGLSEISQSEKDCKE